jgi:translation elongation factor EF-Ts
MPTNQLPTLNELNRKVMSEMNRQTDFDAYGYPANAAVKRIAKEIGKDPSNQDDLNEVYYSLKYLKMQPATSERNQ